MSEKIPCSVVILTRNSAKSLPQALRNLQSFGEVLIHDANSEDNTVEIARQFGARVEKQYDTEEKSVRIKDFTEMRMKQRAAATYDWILYLDADEYLSDGMPEEIGEILRTAEPKTIVKFPRLPVIDGIIRTHGMLYPEVMPRIHNRASGATLRKGKIVHEKYEYDSSFKEIVTKHPLLFPLETVAELRGKDDRYLTLEVERIQKEGYPWSHYFRWMLLREPLIMLRLSLRILLYSPMYFTKNVVPPQHDFRYVRYHWRLFRAVTGAMFAHPRTSGKI